MLYEIEQKVSYLSELSVHSESLLLEGRAETKGEAEQLTLKLRSLKDSLLELQQMLQDKQVDIQVRTAVICYFFTVSTFMAASTPQCIFTSQLSFLHASLSFLLLCCIMLNWPATSMLALCKKY